MTDLIETTFHWLREKLIGSFSEAGIKTGFPEPEIVA
jgi:hypothetical protein